MNRSLLQKRIYSLFYSTLIVAICTLFLSGCAGGVFSFWTSKTISNAERMEGAKTALAPSSIVLMLPLKGPLAQTSQAIRNGFLAAYYYAKATQPGVVIKVVDTSGADVAALYNQAVLSGVNVIVGPLTKLEVETMAGLPNLTIPVIALNTLDDYQSRAVNNLYQFGLLPQDEGVEVANKMIGDNHQRVAVVAPEGPWGEKVVKAFSEKFTSLGGKVVAQLNYVTREDLAAGVCQMIAADPSQMCVKRKFRNQNREADVPQLGGRRQDIDSIFVVAAPVQGRQIVPLLKFYYAGDLPVYSISSIYSGKANPNLDQDLDGVTFCDTQWVIRDVGSLSPELQAMRQQINELWGSSFANHSRLYALGIDAYNLSQSLSTIIAAPESGFAGATGTLFLDNHNHFYRGLIFAEFRHGVPEEK